MSADRENVDADAWTRLAVLATHAVLAAAGHGEPKASASRSSTSTIRSVYRREPPPPFGPYNPQSFAELPSFKSFDLV